MGCSLCSRFPQINQRKEELGRVRVGACFIEYGVEKCNNNNTLQWGLVLVVMGPQRRGSGSLMGRGQGVRGMKTSQGIVYVKLKYE